MKASDFEGFGWDFPWQPISRAARDAYVLELQTELCPEHLLHGCKVTAIARVSNGDDILFLVHNDPMLLAVVHLTFTGRREANPLWPSVQCYGSIEEWIQKVFIPDCLQHQDQRPRKVA